MKKVAINGFGRIGRAFLRSYYSRYEELKNQFEIIHINQPAKPEQIAYLTEYDSLYGRLNAKVSFDEKYLFVNSNSINLTGAYDISQLDWNQIDVLIEASGSFDDLKSAQSHIEKGAKKILFAHPATKAVDFTVIFGVNDSLLTNDTQRISAASCTTNCLVPLLDILQKSYEIESLSATTLHSNMTDQKFLDSFTQSATEEIKLRSGASIMPIKTQLALGVEKLMPELAGKIIANHIRVPVLGASAMDINLSLATEPNSVAEIKKLFIEKATGAYKDVLATSDRNLTSVDFLQQSFSSIVDLNSIQLLKNRLRILAWFDSEWGFANRLLDITKLLSKETQSD